MLSQIPPMWCLLFLTLGSIAGADDGESPAERMRQRVQALLQEGQLDAAVKAAQSMLAERPNDEAVRDEFVALHLALARQFLRDEDFASAEAALGAVLEAMPAHRQARTALARIAAARRQAPQRAAQARTWLEVEWFEPAFRAFGQAVALAPQRGAEWRADHVRAAIGAGDDHYCCKNFREAFYCYDAAMKLSEGGPAAAPWSLASRWLQCLVHTLGDDIDRVAYPEAYWRSVLNAVGAIRRDGPGGADLRAMVRGLAYEDLESPALAAADYTRVLGRTMSDVSPESVRRARRSALRIVRRHYDPGLTGRRAGAWMGEQGQRQDILSVPRFRIHHANPAAAAKLAAALAFHFDRIAGLLGRAPEAIPWAKPCDVYLHADLEAFRAATGQTGEVTAVSLIRLRGDALAAHAVHVWRGDPILLSTTLAHELTHLMLSAVTGYRPLPAALREGAALLAEPRCRRLQFARVFAGLERPRRPAALLAVRELHPTEPAFYAESLRLAQLLAPDGQLEQWLTEPDGGWTVETLAARCGVKRAADLERRYVGRTDDRIRLGDAGTDDQGGRKE